jgi:hypothetical protein
MMLAGLPVPNDAVQELVVIVREAAELWRDLGQSGVVADEPADRLERALADEVKLLALSLDERALLLAALEDPPQELAELTRRAAR